MVLRQWTTGLNQQRNVFRLFLARPAWSLDHSFVGTDVITKDFEVVAHPHPDADQKLDETALAKVVIGVAEINEPLALLPQGSQDVLIDRLAAKVNYLSAWRVEQLVALLAQHVLVSQVNHRPAESLIQQAGVFPSRPANHECGGADGFHLLCFREVEV